MSNIEHATTLWLVERCGSHVALSRSIDDGIPDPVLPPPSLFKIAFVSTAEASQSDWNRSWTELSDPYAPIAVKLPSPDGPPSQIVVVYGYRGEETVSFRIGLHVHKKLGRTYNVVRPSQGWGWESELCSGRFGYFLIGACQGANLWRISRLEIDHIGRCLFSVSPVRLPHGLPGPNFHSVDEPIRSELLQHWSELELAYIEHRAYALVTAAKNIGEALLVWHLGDNNGRKRKDIGTLLQRLRVLHDDKVACETVPFSRLDFHLLRKLRILHSRTHPDHAARERLTPELAVSTAQDIVAVLQSLGLVDDQ